MKQTVTEFTHIANAILSSGESYETKYNSVICSDLGDKHQVRRAISHSTLMEGFSEEVAFVFGQEV